MKNSESKAERILKICFKTVLCIAILYLIIGEILLPREIQKEKKEADKLEVTWNRVFEDGSRSIIEIPSDIDVKKGDTVVIEAVLPQTLEDNKWLTLISLRQDIKIYIDGVLREEYSTKNTRLFGKVSPKAMIFTKLSSQDCGSTIRIELVSNSQYAGNLYEIYYDEKYDIWFWFFSEYGSNLLIAFMLAAFGIMTVILSIVLYFSFKRSVVLAYLGCGMLLMANWLACESILRQIMLPNVSVASDVAYISAMLLAIPFMFYVDDVQKYRYHKSYMAAESVVMLNCIICSCLYILGIIDLSHVLNEIEMLIVASVIFTAGTFIIDLAKGCIGSYKWVAIGFIGVFVGAIDEVARVSNRTSGHGLIIMATALLFMMSVLKAGQDLLDIEKEKQRAIISGEAKANFLANMSHEIRTPINTIIGMNEMLERENRDNNLGEYIVNIKQSSRMLLALVNDILDFSKIESGKFDILEAPYHVSSLLNDVIQAIRPRIEGKGLKLELEIDKNMPSVLYGDEIRIKQVLNNILTNAAKYTKQGSVTFSASGLYMEDGEFVLKFGIADTGIGIREEDLPKLFDSFTRFEEKKNANIEGTGLGLTITKRLTEQMNGEISVKSTYGEGSVFCVVLPQKVVDADPVGDIQAVHMQIESYGASRQTFYAPNADVLVVDDNEMNLTVVKVLLKRTQIKIDTASGGTECLSLCRKKKYDLIFMDHMMPEMDGIETLHILKENEDGLNADVPVIALTANAIKGVKDMYLSEGFADYLSKPIVPEKLEEILIKYLPEDKTVLAEKSTYALEENTGAEEGNGNIIDAETGLGYCADDKDLYIELLKTYYEQAEEYKKNLQKYYEAKDWKNYTIIVHAIKSTSLTIGAKHMSELAKEYESAAKAGEAEKLLQEAFMEEYEKTLNAIKNMI